MVDKQEENQVQTAVRMPESWLDRIDKLAENLSEPGRPATRAGAPTHCEHNVFMVAGIGVGARTVSEDDAVRLKALGFLVDDGNDCWVSYRFGSC